MRKIPSTDPRISGLLSFNTDLEWPVLSWHETNSLGDPVTLTYGFPILRPDAVSEPGYRAMSDPQKDAVRDVLKMVSDYIAVSFVEHSGPGSADIEFGTANLNASAQDRIFGRTYSNYDTSVDGTHQSITATAVLLANDLGHAYTRFSNPTAGDKVYFTIIHEIAHALGLGHPFADPDRPDDTIVPAGTDNTMNTVMSYTDGFSDGAEPSSLMAFDIMALQYLYGANTNSSGDTRYDIAELDTYDWGRHVVWDSGGDDLVSLRNMVPNTGYEAAAGEYQNYFYGPQGIHFSLSLDGFGFGRKKANDYQTIATRYSFPEISAIESVEDSLFNDVLIGNALDNSFDLSYGIDIVDGGDGTDIVYVNGEFADYTISSTLEGHTYLPYLPLEFGAPGLTVLSDNRSEKINRNGETYSVDDKALRSIERIQFSDGLFELQNGELTLLEVSDGADFNAGIPGFRFLGDAATVADAHLQDTSGSSYHRLSDGSLVELTRIRERGDNGVYVNFYEVKHYEVDGTLRDSGTVFTNNLLTPLDNGKLLATEEIGFNQVFYDIVEIGDAVELTASLDRSITLDHEGSIITYRVLADRNHDAGFSIIMSGHFQKEIATNPDLSPFDGRQDYFTQSGVALELAVVDEFGAQVGKRSLFSDVVESSVYDERGARFYELDKVRNPVYDFSFVALGDDLNAVVANVGPARNYINPEKDEDGLHSVLFQQDRLEVLDFSSFRFPALGDPNHAYSGIRHIPNGGDVAQFALRVKDVETGQSAGEVPIEFGPAGLALSTSPHEETYRPDLTKSSTLTLDTGYSVSLMVRPDGSQSGIFAQVFDPLGMAIGDPYRINEEIFGTQDSPQMRDLGSNRFEVFWQQSEGLIVSRQMSVLSEDGQVLTGTAGSDVLRGFAGPDTINGLDGADTLIGGDGDDTIYGGDTEADLRDVIFAGEGDDFADGGHGNDELYGMGGSDTLEGGFGSDTLIGGDGDDVLNGGAGADLIFGGDGFDFINGGFGSDRLNGGAGADRFFHVGVAGHGSDWIQDYDAAEGDVLVFGGAAGPANFQVNITNTDGAGAAGVDEAFVIYKPTGQILWALVDGAGQDEINIRLGDQEYDLLSF